MNLFGLLTVFSLFLTLSFADDLQWTKITPTGDLPVNLTGSVLEYDNFGTIYQLLGHREIWPLDGNIDITFINDVYSYDINNNEWDLVTVSGTKPVPRAYPAGTWVPLLRRIYFYGGSTFNNQYGNITLYDDLWYFNVVTKTFTQVTPTSLVRPGGRSGAKLYHVGQKLYLFGGVADVLFGQLPIYTNELWEFDLLSKEWTLLSDEGPSARSEAQDFERLGKLYINGGEAFSLETFDFETPNDTWVFDTFTSEWEDITPSDYHNILPARNYAASFRFVVQWGVYGGELEGNQTEGCGAPFGQNVGNDLWIFFPTLEIWQKVTPSGTAPPPLKRAMGVGVGLTDAYIFSGFSFTCPGVGQVYNNNIYKLSYE